MKFSNYNLVVTLKILMSQTLKTIYFTVARRILNRLSGQLTRLVFILIKAVALTYLA